MAFLVAVSYLDQCYLRKSTPATLVTGNLQGPSSYFSRFEGIMFSMFEGNFSGKKFSHLWDFNICGTTEMGSG